MVDEVLDAGLEFRVPLEDFELILLERLRLVEGVLSVNVKGFVFFKGKKKAGKGHLLSGETRQDRKTSHEKKTTEQRY